MVAPKSQEFNMVHSKKCFKCNAIKPLTDFYKHSRMADGHVNKCKECNKTDVNKNRLENLDYYRAYDKERGKLDHRIKLATEQTRIWRAQDVRRAAAHNAVARAIKKGMLNREPCKKCGAEKTEAHHEDYDKPLEIVWLCCPCHKQRHKEMRMPF